MPTGDFSDKEDWCAFLGQIPGWVRIAGDLIMRQGSELVVAVMFLPGVGSGLVSIYDEGGGEYHPPFYCQNKLELIKALEICEILQRHVAA